MFATCNLISHSRIAWLCLLAFIYSGITLWSIHTDLPSSLPSESTQSGKTDWQQPIAVNALFPDPISAQQWHFNYEETEEILTQVKLNSHGELLINPELAHILTKSVASMPQNLNKKTENRIAFLVSKGLPGIAGTQLATLLMNYYHLQDATNKTTNKTTSLANFLKTEARQNHHLGTDVATQLFGNKRVITRYLLERLAIQENPNLSHQQKEQQRQMLKSQLKRQ